MERLVTDALLDAEFRDGLPFVGRQPAVRRGDAGDGARTRRRRDRSAADDHALLQAQIDFLEGDVRVVMERGLVEGEVFHRGAVSSSPPISCGPRSSRTSRPSFGKS